MLSRFASSLASLDTARAGRPARHGFRSAPSIALFAAVLAAGVCLLAPDSARAQAQRLDRNVLIDALADEGMSDLLLHLVETDPPDDPVVARKVKIAQNRIRYNNQDLPREQQHQALRDAINATRELIDEFYDRTQRPVWQTDLAEMLMADNLQVLHNQAGLFYEFGVPTPAQRQAFEQAVPEAFEAANDARAALFQLRGRVGRDEELEKRLTNTGLFSRLFEDYQAKRMPYFLAQSAYRLTLLPDDAPYYANLAQDNPRVPEQADSPQRERRRLLDLTINQLEPFVNGQVDTPGIQPLARLLTARAMVRQERYDAAIEELDQVIDDTENGRADLVARLAKAHARRQQGDFGGALDVIAGLASHSMVEPNPLFRLLVTDAEHRIRMARAEQREGEARKQAIEAAYEPYTTLLNDPSIQRQGEALRNYIYRRWQRTIDEDTDLTTLPSVVRLGIAQMARMEGQQQAMQANKAGNPLPDAAARKLQRAVRICETLHGNDLPDEVRAGALFNQAIAQYWLDTKEIGNLVKVGRLFTELAAQMPTHPRADDAIANGINLLRQLHSQQNHPDVVDRAYRRAAEVLFEQFPNSDAADNERLYYAFNVLQQQGEYEAAAEMYAAVPSGHPDYFEARRERLYALEQLYRQASGDQQQTAMQKVIDAAQQLEEEAQNALERGANTAAAQRAVGGARLAQAAMAIERNNTEDALSLLEGFEREFSGESDLIRQALEQRIRALIEAAQQAQMQAMEAAADTDRQQLSQRADQYMQRAVDEAQRMMERFPNNAAAVIDEVLTRLEGQIREKRAQAAEAMVDAEQQQLREAANQMANTAARLAQTLTEWAEQQNYSAKQMVPYRLIEAKSLRLAGEATEAASMLEPLLDQFSNDVGVLTQYAEAMFARGGEQNLTEAARYYDKIITGLQPPYPEQWWNAWMRRLQINDQLDKGTEDIPLRVRQLKRTDPNLGGAPYRETLQQLHDKYAQ